MKMNFIKWITVFYALVVSIGVLVSGCGNSDGSLSLDNQQTAKLVNRLGTYEGRAHSERIMGALMTGTWTAKFFEDDKGRLKCKCSLQLYDSEYGRGDKSVAVADVKLFKGSADGLYDLKAEASFSQNEPDWLIVVNGISLNSNSPIESISLFDMDAYQIKLSRL